MSEEAEQAQRVDRSATIAFRTSEEEKHMVQAVAARRGCLPSEWLRTVLRDSLRRELDSRPRSAPKKP